MTAMTTLNVIEGGRNQGEVRHTPGLLVWVTVDLDAGPLNAATLESWRAEARAVVTTPDSPLGLRALAWRFLRQHGARAGFPRDERSSR